MMEEHSIDKEELIDMLSIHFQNQYAMSPLGAKIWSIIIMDGTNEGLTFEHLVERLNASKSTVSTNLNMLLELERIYYDTKEGDRKKYFKPAPFSERFVRILKNMEFEKLLINKMIQYKSNVNIQCNNAKCDLENIIAYQNHLLEMEKLTYKIMSDLKQIEEKNKQTIQ